MSLRDSRQVFDVYSLIIVSSASWDVVEESKNPTTIWLDGYNPVWMVKLMLF